MTNGKESSTFDIHYLPDDILLHCLARVSRLYYPILSLVSKRFRSLVASLDLYEIRTLLGRTENFLYMCLHFSSEAKPRWYTLCRRPIGTPNHEPNPKPNLHSRWFTSCFKPILTNLTSKKEKKLSENVMVSVPALNNCPLSGLTSTAIGSYIYMIGGYINGALSTRVFFFDCRSHTWHEAPSMPVARNYPLVSVLDGKIYVVDERNVSDSSNLIDFFDPKKQIWEHVPNPSAEIPESYIARSLVFNDKLYLFGDKDNGYKSVVYKPKENRWDAIGLEKLLWLVTISSSCVIDNVCYVLFGGTFLWYDTEKRGWRVLKGLEELPKLSTFHSRVRLVNYGGKLAVLWEKKVRAIGSYKKMIWCAEIALERRNTQEIYGKIEWCDVVLTVPKSCYSFEVVAVNV